ncbi:long chain acyl-CoA synthetase [Emiliania huxleyi CCMP1516]|uniref:AMP-dependent synthetase/ligase domain-containing protein n=2 Tax=Emiliania huxleyi TaxID=2903 RepID=A0A0D3JD59_EMIH1|nr:long chain acyl-CoA synthetase [Emiliania huxleyi CCMP1516]EOD21444.1 long chain acyl-CoA synthetase [Emiliania huxleyi CCMP1516]|eukprot:XP_005773873.1 long chain acyl-CoA synthetase [Emiliania huxleyi CCMP1516]
MAGAAVNHILGLVLVLIDFALYLVTLGPLITLYRYLTAQTVFAKPVADADINKGGPPSKVWRSIDAIEDGKLEDGIAWFGGCHTAYEAFALAYSKFATNRAQGTRTLLEAKVESGYRFPTKARAMFGPTTWRTYAELGELAHAFGAGLRHLGIEPQPADAVSADHKGALVYDETSADWMVAAHGCMSQDIVVATSYATLGVDSVAKAVKQGAVSVLVCNRKAVPALLKMVDQMPSLKVIVYTDALCTIKECESKVSGGKKPTLLSLDEVISIGKAHPRPPTPPKPDSLGVLMYTSGSTGDPKGVMILQKQLLAQMAGLVHAMPEEARDPSVNPGTHIAYLPLAHIFELVIEFAFFGSGHAVGYADPKTLLPGPEKCKPTGSLEEFQPTLMAGVPKVWEAIKAGALAKAWQGGADGGLAVKVSKAGPTAVFLIGLAVKMKALATKQYRYTPLFNLLLKKFKQTTGGQLQLCVSGGGAISGEVQEWEVTLHSEPEITDADGAPYLTTDTLHCTGEVCAGRGEVWMRGNNLSVGYYKMAELTASEYTPDGWFKSGDIGLLTPGGALKIVDRKKNLVKLKGGEYVALEKMNTAYNNSPFVEVEAGGVCCFADHTLDRSVALAQVKEKALVEAAKGVGIEGEPKELAANPEVQALVVASFKEEAKKAGLTALETVIAVYPLVGDPWSPENGCLTATQKLVPKKCFAHNAKELEVVKKKGIR